MNTTKDLKRDLKGDSKFALNTFTKLLQAAGPTYITIDGLDEIDDCTQQVFLHLLLDVLKSLPHVKLLISSRRVERIERILKPIAVILPIDQKNSGCIEAYVSHRGGEWLDNSFFDSDARSEVRQLLNPLASKADGMFLYARIILEDVEMLQDLDSIRDQLRALPEGLDEAYERILQRITKYPPAAQKQCKKILSWIACSPVQITRHEMEQALIIQVDQRRVPPVRSTLNTLPLCGPLVEVEDEHLKFVHFTVKEYLLRHQKNNFLDEGEALLEISTTCLAYLCSDLLDPDLSDDDMERNVTSGAYRLLNFAHRQWAECLRLCMCTRQFRDELPLQLVPLLGQIMLDLGNPYYSQDSDTNLGLWSLDKFESNLDRIEAISRNLDFRSIMASSYDWRLEEGNITTPIDLLNAQLRSPQETLAGRISIRRLSLRLQYVSIGCYSAFFAAEAIIQEIATVQRFRSIMAFLSIDAHLSLVGSIDSLSRAELSAMSISGTIPALSNAPWKSVNTRL
ncbi:hypothetical protein FOBRF1_011077 [Fusarium oxysporum]